ncbi:MAG: alkaline phosphatase family protein [Thermoleophilaceae bacterium]
MMRRRAGTSAIVVLACALVAPGVAEAQAPRLSGPPGVSSSKVLVIGVDGMRWDSLQRVIAQGGAPNLARLADEGFGVPTLLEYAPPEAATLSEVGWSTIAGGVWPAKHKVRGVFLNNDPGQATKNGYHDFLTRLEQERPSLSTFLASDWANIGLHENGGPIFSDAIDVKHALAAEDSIESYDRGDEEVTGVSTSYLREGSPDAGFVYLGLVDEVAHAVGSATPTYPSAIAATDRRIGRLLAAVKARREYARERWTIVVTTDHGQQPLPFGSVASHGFGTTLERRSFVIASGSRVRAEKRGRERCVWSTSRRRSSTRWVSARIPPGISTGAPSSARAPRTGRRRARGAASRVACVCAGEGLPAWGSETPAGGFAPGLVRRHVARDGPRATASGEGAEW